MNVWRIVAQSSSSVLPDFEDDNNKQENICKYRKFCSATMVRQLSQKLQSDLEPFSESIYASVLIADISGFTLLSSRLSAEELKLHINLYFSNLLGVIRKFHGDVIKFLGDAVLIIWPVDKFAPYDIKAATALMASLCALQLIKKCGNYEKGEGNSAVSLKLHCGVGTGILNCMCLGEGERWEYFVTGDPLHQLAEAVPEASMGEVCVSEKTYRLIYNKLDAKLMPKGNYLLSGKCASITNSFLGNESTSSPLRNGIANTDPPKERGSIASQNLNAMISGDSPLITSTEPSMLRRTDSFVNKNKPKLFGGSNSGVYDQDNNLLMVPETPPPPSRWGMLRRALSSKSFKDEDTVIDKKKMMLSDQFTDLGPTESRKDSKKSKEVEDEEEDDDVVPDSNNFGKLVKGAPPFNRPSMTRSISEFTANTSVTDCMVAPAICNVYVHRSPSRNASIKEDISMITMSRMSSTDDGGDVFISHPFDNDLIVSRSMTSGRPSFDTKINQRRSVVASNSTTTPEDAVIASLSEVPPLVSGKSFFGMAPKSLSQVGRALTMKIRNDPFEYLENNPAVNAVKEYLKDFLSQVPDELICPPPNKPQEPETEAVATTAVGGGGGSTKKPDEHNEVRVPELVNRMRLFVHETAREGINGSASLSLFQLRSVTTIFIEILDLEHELLEGFIRRPLQVISMTLACLHRFGGSLRQYTVDDKGCVVIAAYGLPGTSYEDNSLRAVETTVAIRKLLKSARIQCRAGIAEGTVYCGLVGSSYRCEYAMMGRSVNLAARLMGKCVPGEILVNDSVRDSSLSAFVFDALPPIAVKGYTEPVSTFRPTARTTSDALLGSAAIGDVGFIGRQKELSALESSFESIAHNSTNNSLMCSFLLEGPPNVGKSRLIAEALKLASDKFPSLHHVIGNGSSSHISSPYYVIRQLLIQLMNLDLQNDMNFTALKTVKTKTSSLTNTTVRVQESAERLASQQVENWFSQYATGILLDEHEIPKLKLSEYLSSAKLTEDGLASPVLASIVYDNLDEDEDIIQIECGKGDVKVTDLMPLLGDVLSIYIEDNKVTMRLSEEERVRMTELFIIRLFLISLQRQIDLVVINNLQWCDIDSLRIILLLRHTSRRGMFLCASRPQSRTQLRQQQLSQPQDKQQLERRSNLLFSFSHYCQRITLQSLSCADIRILVERVIGDSLLAQFPGVLTQDNLEIIMERSGDSLFHATILASALKNALTEGKFTRIQDLNAGAHSIIVEKFDKLRSDDQTVLKTASVVGMSFDAEMIRHLLIELKFVSCLPGLLPTLSELVELQLLIENQGEYYFSDQSVKESIYGLMLETQRSQIHGIVAMYLENRYGNNPYYFKQIALHYSHSDYIQKKILYKVKSAEIAFNNHFYSLSHQCYNELVTWTTGSDIGQLLDRCTGFNMNIKKSVVQRGGRCLTTWTPLRAMRLRSKKYKKEKGVTRRKRSIARAAFFSAALGDYSTAVQNRGWITVEDISQKINVLDIGMGDNTRVRLSPFRVALWVTEIGILQYVMGNLRNSNNALVLGLHCLGVYNPEHKQLQKNDVITKGMCGKKGLEMIHYAVRILAIIFWLRGFPDSALEVLDSFRNIVSISKSTANTIETAKRRSTAKIGHNNSEGSVVNVSDGLDILSITPFKEGNEGEEDVVDEAEESNLDALQSARVDVLNGVVALALASKVQGRSYTHMTVWQPIQSNVNMDSKTVNLKGFEMQYDFLLLVCKAFQSVAVGNLSDARRTCTQAINRAIAINDSQKQHMTVLAIAWISFLSGDMKLALTSATQVLQYTTIVTHRSMRIWILEIDILVKTVTGDMAGALESIHLVHAFQKSNALRATTSAVVAYYHAMKGETEFAAQVAHYSCVRLSARSQGTPMAGVLIFCAIIAGLEVLEKTLLLAPKSPVRTGNTIRQSAYSLYAMVKRPSIFYVKLKESVDTAINSLQELSVRFPVLASFSIAVNLRRIRYDLLLSNMTTSSSSSPTAYNVCSEIAALPQINSKIKELSQDIRKVPFGFGYLHMQRFLLYQDLGQNRTIFSKGNSHNNVLGVTPEIDESRNHALQQLHRIGAVHLLDVLYLYCDPESSFIDQDSKLSETDSSFSVRGRLSVSLVRSTATNEDDTSSTSNPPSLPTLLSRTVPVRKARSFCWDETMDMKIHNAVINNLCIIDEDDVDPADAIYIV